MMTLRRRHFLAMTAAATLPLPASAGPSAKGLPVSAVYELFTSQGCSSCPPADALFHALRNEPGLLALSLPVTIWDHLGWKDTFGQTVFSGRQKGYSVARGDRQIYTPQAIINGAAHCIGSDQKALDTARRETVMQVSVLAITPKLTLDTAGWTLRLPDSPVDRPPPPNPQNSDAEASQRRSVHAGMIMLVQFQREATVEIAKGENGGRTIRYGNIVRAITKIGDYNGAAMTLPLPQNIQATQQDGFAILLQAGTEKHPGVIVGAVEAPRV